MKALLTLATLLTIATPATASLSDNYQQQQSEINTAAAKCKSFYDNGQFLPKMRLRMPERTHGVSRYFVGEDGGVVFADNPLTNLQCEFLGYLNVTWQPEVTGRCVIGEFPREWKIENGDLIKYTRWCDGSVSRYHAGVRR